MFLSVVFLAQTTFFNGVCTFIDHAGKSGPPPVLFFIVPAAQTVHASVLRTFVDGTLFQCLLFVMCAAQTAFDDLICAIVSRAFPLRKPLALLCNSRYLTRKEIETAAVK